MIRVGTVLVFREVDLQRNTRAPYPSPFGKGRTKEGFVVDTPNAGFRFNAKGGNA